MSRWSKARSLVGIGALAAIAVAYLTWDAAPATTRPAGPSAGVDLSALPASRVTTDPRRAEFTIELPPVDLPAGPGAHSREPVGVAELSVTGAIFGLRTEVVDEAGRPLPAEFIHHFNVMAPSDRELFLPIARRVAASGMETGVVRLPWLLFGAPIRAGERVIANAMLHNPTPTAYRAVRIRMILSYVPSYRPWPLFTALPWQLDVAFPVGDKSFDLPPGRSERAYEGSPAVPGDLVAIGGHLHEYGESIELWDATSGALLWRGEPASGAHGGRVPIGMLYSLTRLGTHIVPTRRYRIRVVYDNPTGRVVTAGGMGVIAGLFVPDRDAVWPQVDPGDSLYQQDLQHFVGRSFVSTHAHAHMGH